MVMKTFCAFSGADISFTLSGEGIGEIESCTYEESLIPRYDDEGRPLPAITGKIVQIIPTEEPRTRELMRGGHEDFVIFFADERGSKATRTFEELQFTKRVGGAAVDDVLLTEEYHFTAKSTSFGLHDWEFGDDGKYRIVEGDK